MIRKKNAYHAVFFISVVLPVPAEIYLGFIQFGPK